MAPSRVIAGESAWSCSISPAVTACTSRIKACLLRGSPLKDLLGNSRLPYNVDCHFDCLYILGGPGKLPEDQSTTGTRLLMLQSRCQHLGDFVHPLRALGKRGEAQ